MQIRRLSYARDVRPSTKLACLSIQQTLFAIAVTMKTSTQRKLQLSTTAIACIALIGCGGTSSEPIDPNAVVRDVAEARFDRAAPTIAILSPTTSGTFGTSSSAIQVAGSASDDRKVAQVTWVSDRGNSGIAVLSVSRGGRVTWSTSGIPLVLGENTITVSPGLHVVIRLAIMASVLPQVTVMSLAGSSDSPIRRLCFRARAARKFDDPQVSEYW